jgi:molecular chaperone DnaK
MALIGIDLGTTNSVAAIESQHGDRRAPAPESLPSVVAFLPNGTIRVGEVARRRRSIDSANTIFSSKRVIGRRYDCSETRNFIVRYPFEIVDQGGWPAFRTRAGELTPTRIAATILEALIERVQVDPSVSEVVITYPVNFSEDQLEATQQAADWAGLGHARFIDEPSATATAYKHADHPFQRALVYDLGGGTFDCAVVDGSNGSPRVIAHASDLCLGGDDIDHQLAAWAARHVLEKYNWDLTNYSEIYDRLLAACEDAKIALSTTDSVELHLSQIDPECTAVEESITISRTILEQLCQDIVRRSFIACDSVLRQAGLKPPDIDSVFLAGGTTHLPVIQQGVEAYFGHAGHMEHEPTEVVALGARLSAGAVHG